jgi:CMP/dCMP kinase
MIIAIDGPSAAGKGTLARHLATHYKLPYLDTGSLYRRVGLAFVKTGGNPVQIAQTLESLAFNDADLRSETVAKAAAEVAAIPAVRHALLDFQRNFAAQKRGAVLDGRDIGTVICPNADFKFYVTASIQARAERRFQELRHTGVLLENIIDDVRARDARDAANSAAADDAIMIDTSELTSDEVLQEVIKIINEGT